MWGDRTQKTKTPQYEEFLIKIGKETYRTASFRALAARNFGTRIAGT
jgi:hypothetical protein